MLPLSPEHRPDDPEIFACTSAEASVAIRALAYNTAMRADPPENAPEVIAFRYITDTAHSGHSL